MSNAVCDITPDERRMLSRLHRCPVLYLGSVSLRDFFHMSSGYRFAMQNAGQLNSTTSCPRG